MTKTKIRIEKVTLEEIKKILSPALLEQSTNHNNHQRLKKKKQQRSASNAKSRY